jgi:hypothetical protein
MTYPDITENFDGGSPGDSITTANTAFPYIEDGTLGPSVFTSDGADGQGARAITPDGTFGTGSYYYDSLYTNTTWTIAPDDWTARASFRITDAATSPGGSFSILDVFVGEVGKTPANWNAGTNDSIDINYNVGSQSITAGSDTLDIAAHMGQWLTIEVNGTNGSWDFTITTLAGAVIGSGAGIAIAPNLYRARSSVNCYCSVDSATRYDVDSVYFGRTAATPTVINYDVPLRRYPRDDNLATGSALRNYPPPKSYQRGIRRAGGYL